MDGRATSLERAISLETEGDIIEARMHAREMAREMGFDLLGQVEVATAVSELARNVIQYAGTGEIQLCTVTRASGAGLQVLCRDRGPGIADLDRVLAGGHSTSGRLGRGLSGARRLFDEFSITAPRGAGTEIVGTKWL